MIRGYTAEKAQLEEMRQQKIRELEEARAALERMKEEKNVQAAVSYFVPFLFAPGFSWTLTLRFITISFLLSILLFSFLSLCCTTVKRRRGCCPSSGLG